jgi:hypothetical protein
MKTIVEMALMQVRFCVYNLTFVSCCLSGFLTVVDVVVLLCSVEVPQGVYSLDDLKELGAERGWCPYFMTRHLIHHSTILVYNYQYMLDPKGMT